MQNNSEIEKMLALDKTQIRESILMSMLQSVREDTTISPALKPLLEVLIAKHCLDAYLDQKIAYEHDDAPDILGSGHKRIYPAPAAMNNLAPPANAQDTHSSTVTLRPAKSREDARKIGLDLGKVQGDFAKEKESPETYFVEGSPPTDSHQGGEFKAAINQEKTQVRIEDIVHVQSNPRKKTSGSSKKTEEKKIRDPLKEKDSPRTKESPRTKTDVYPMSLSPLRKSSRSPRWLFHGGGSESPKRRKNSFDGRGDFLPASSFNELLPIDKEALENYLNFLKPYLKQKNNEIEIVNDPDKPGLYIVVTPQRDRNKNVEYLPKTALLIDQHIIEGIGANKVVKGYDLLNGTLLAVKILNSGVTDKTRQEEIENLQKRGWFYGCYQLREYEYALAMKYIPGDTLLQILYVIDDTVPHDSIYEHSCIRRKNLSYELQYQIIIKLMKEVLKLHEKYQLLHRDLKPANIKIYYRNGDLKVRIIDLGDAVPVGSEKRGLCGSDGYTDPEISGLEDTRPYKKEHDIFSLGVILAEILSNNNYQHAIREHKKKHVNDIVTPKITPKQIRALLADVFIPDALSEQHDSYEDHQKSMHNFMLLELKKLSLRMITTRLSNSSLKDEIERIEAIAQNCDKFSKKMKAYFDNKEDVEHSLNKMNKKFNAGLFFPKKEIKIHSIEEATEWFKKLHAATEEEVFTLFF
ncbi:protein kinase family protein [Fluoribacter dumoffii]|uniref:Protein kinase domain n=1 Tax=Fluoribacter dumoffii TaxID=463 RepID=A0A377GDG7_9GAMM|nr:protein kinase family protein [Fluoribacter dumoffii]KTC91172.1 serine/threonine-protein kinase [Fluoribacter dumoffii NY 23]MCW8416795.1 protein kinase family protein [Fluoribacter dumoffii]MCW8455365.1 protein kinase family protein [Fluoribacter dumoffii]MCW8460557.1 protein kinase family protein [Fluoribacter dumoffii]MCW8484038.1 protein kinase family protein [Fluoribacter dumoffii]